MSNVILDKRGILEKNVYKRKEIVDKRKLRQINFRKKEVGRSIYLKIE